MYQIGLMLYNSFLPTLGPGNLLGKISGLGIAFGYGGPLFILPLAKKVAEAGNWLVFPFGGLAFFIFSIPLFIFVPERKPLIEERFNRRVFFESIRSFMKHFEILKNDRTLFYILLANFFAIDAVNTAIIFMTTYLENAAWMDLAEGVRDSYKMFMMFALIISSMILSFFVGYVCDKASSKKAFILSIVSMIGAILCGILFTNSGLWLILFVAPLGGMGLGGVWTAGRKMVADITPKGKEGKYFGLYGLVGKVSALGTILFALITWALPLMGAGKQTAYKAAFVFPCIALVLSVILLKNTKAGKR